MDENRSSGTGLGANICAVFSACASKASSFGEPKNDELDRQEQTPSQRGAERE